MGFDLVRNEFGGWRVLEDNVRNPSGAAYAMAIRELIDEVLPDLPRPSGLLDPAAALPMLRTTLLRRPASRAASRGAAHQRPGQLGLVRAPAAGRARRAAAGAADDLRSTTDGCPHRRRRARSTRSTSGWTTSWSTCARRPGGAVGAQIFEVAAAGGVVLANAPGNGIADDKAMYCLRRRAHRLLPGRAPAAGVGADVPARATRPSARTVLERVGELVTKPVDGHGGAGVLIGPDATAAEVAARRAEIAADPDALGRPGGGRAVLPPDLRRAAGCSRGTSTCEPSCTSAAPGRTTARWPTWR